MENINQNVIEFDITNELEQLKALKKYKEQLDELLNRIKISRDNYVNSNLSGKTYESSVNKNNLFINSIENRIKELVVLISKLEASCNIYNNYRLDVGKSVSGGYNES